MGVLKEWCVRVGRPFPGRRPADRRVSVSRLSAVSGTPALLDWSRVFPVSCGLEWSCVGSWPCFRFFPRFPASSLVVVAVQSRGPNTLVQVAGL